MKDKQSVGVSGSIEPASDSSSLTVAQDAEPESLLVRVAQQAPWTIVRAGMAAIPVVGGALVEFSFGIHSSLKMGRLEKTVAKLKHDVQQLTEGQVDREFIETEEFMDIVEAGLRGATQTASESKRARFRQVIVGACKPQAHRMRAETFVAAVTELSDDDVDVLRAIHQCEAEGHPDPVGGRRVPAASESLDMLQRFGFVQAPRAAGGSFLVTQAHEPERPVMTELGYAFFNWVLATEHDPEPPGAAPGGS